MSNPAFLGIDIGTSGIRACCIDADEQELTSHHIAFKSQQPIKGKNEQDPDDWTLLLDKLLSAISRHLKELAVDYRICSISIDGTSSTLIACSRDGTALSPALMYNDQQSQKQAEIISRIAPAESAVHGATSSLAKALNLLERFPQTELFCHQADWLAASLTGVYGVSDENNCLKMGYDSIHKRWPEWLQISENGISFQSSMLPKVIRPGSVIAEVKAALKDKYQLAEGCVVTAGTTDSNAAVLATGANQVGDAVTSLGSTLVIKVFSDRPIFEPKFGIYSHRLNNYWLVGGASNSGGAVLSQYFNQTQIDEMTPKLKPEQSIGLDYYPLPATGERFPVNDCNKQNRTEPRPSDDIDFFQALLEGIADIEAEGYKKLNALGASPAQRIFTAGGGSKNTAWKKIRERATGIDIINAVHSDACYGSALLAKSGYYSSNS